MDKIIRYKKEEKNKEKILIASIIIASIIILCSFFAYKSFTGKSILNLNKDNFQIDEIISGNLNLILQEGELVPADTIIRISFGNITEQLTLEEFIELSELDIE